VMMLFLLRVLCCFLLRVLCSFYYVFVICCWTKLFCYVLNNIYYLNFHYVLLYVKDVHLNAKMIRIQFNFVGSKYNLDYIIRIHIGCKCNSDYVIRNPSAYDSFVWITLHWQFLWSMMCKIRKCTVLPKD